MNLSSLTSGIKSIQRGVVTGLTGTTGTITISSVNTAKSVVTGENSVLFSSGYPGNVSLSLTNSTTITWTSVYNISSSSISWQVVEYN